jgi:hypothetical protein
VGLGLSRRWVGVLIIGCIAPLLFALRAFPGTFKNPLILPTSSDVRGLATGDVNQDGKADLVYLDGSQYGQQSLHILLGNGNGTFTHQQDMLVPAGICCAITLADVTGDGIPDVILEGGQQTGAMVAVMVGNGDGTFQSPVVSTFPPSNSTASPVFSGLIGVGDINGDGHADLVVTQGGDHSLYLLAGDGTGKFTLLGTLLTYTRNSVYLTDLNGDGHLDIVATDHLGAEFLVFLGKGDGTFQSSVTYTGQASTNAMILTDVDGDGHPDMLTQYFPGTVAYFKGNADGTFGTLTPIAASNSVSPLVGTGDFNADGVADLFFTSPTGIGTEMGTGGLNYTAMKPTVSGSSSFAPTPVTADFNADGHLDVAMGVEGGIAILPGKGDGTFASADVYDMGQEVGGAAVADFNGDGKPDIAVTLPATFPRLLLGDGTGNFTLGPDPNAGYKASGADVTAVAADFNGDGKRDLDIGNLVVNTAIGNSPGQSVTFGNGDGTFTTPVGIVDSTPVVADVNGDGRSDMIYVNGNSIIVSLGQANDSFTDVTTPLRVTDDYDKYNVGDVNNDGKPDLVINYNNHFEVWLGNGDGSFSFLNLMEVQSTVTYQVAAIADLDGDGNADLVFSPGSNAGVPLAIFYGNGDGTFQAPVYLPVSHGVGQVVVADVNGDNKPDLIMTDGSGIAVMMNLGGRKFDSEVDYVGGASISALNVVDVNGDGFPDIVTANTNGSTVAVLLNQPNGTSPAGSFVNGTISISPAAPTPGQPISFSLAVSSQTAGAAVPTGTVSFYIDGGFQADVPLTNGTATYNFTGTLIPIQHTLVATYNGDSVYAARSFASVFDVVPPTYSTTTALTATPTTLLASQTVRLTATVSSAVPVLGGRVTFFDGGQVIGSTPIYSQPVVYLDTALLGAGVHSLSAKFDGYTQTGSNGQTSLSYVAAIFSPSTSSAVSVTVNTNATATSLSASATSLTAGTVATFTANVNSSGGTPFGGVSFYDGSTLLGTMALDANAAAGFSTASLSAGTHSIIASFNANGPFAGSTSAPLSVTVTAAATTLARVVVSLDPETNAADGGSTLVATVSALSGSPRGIVTFLDDGRILGKAVTDASGRASLAIGTPASGIHDLSASFAGEPGFAPAVSPVVEDRWPATGPGFGLAVGSGVVSLSASAPASLPVRVAPLAGYAQPVQLSCAEGLPTGYACNFTPGALSGGTSILTISPAGRGSASPAGGMPWYWPALGLLLLAVLAGLLWPARGMRLRRAVALLAVCCAFGALAGCAANSSSSRETVLTIQAKSGTAPDSIVHAAQVTLRLP